MSLFMVGPKRYAQMSITLQAKAYGALTFFMAKRSMDNLHEYQKKH